MDWAFRFEQRLLGELSSGGLLARGQAVVLGVSGGADSMALLASLRALGSRHGFPLELHVAHFNHRLRGADSERDAAFVAEAARRWGLPFALGESNAMGGSGGNLEARARSERHAFLFARARALGAGEVATGHTRDDQAETILMRLAQGSGVGALGAMRMRREDGLIRPLLRTARADCARYLRECDIGWVQDASNDDCRFLRNRIRHRVLPVLVQELGEHLPERLAVLAHDLQVESGLADERLAEVLGTRADEALEVAPVLAADAAAGRLVHRWLARLGVVASRRQVEAVVRLARHGGPSDGADLAGVRVERCYGVLLCRPKAPSASPIEAPETLGWVVPGSLELASGWRLTAQKCARSAGQVRGGREVVVDAEQLRGELTARRVRPGDRIQLRGGTKKLSDILVDARIPRIERAALVVVSRGDDILWVPGVAVAAGVLPGDRTKTLMTLRSEWTDCRHPGSVVENRGQWVRFR